LTIRHTPPFVPQHPYSSSKLAIGGSSIVDFEVVLSSRNCEVQELSSVSVITGRSRK